MSDLLKGNSALVTQHLRVIEVTHVVTDVTIPYDAFTRTLERLLGKYNNGGVENVLTHPDLARRVFEAMAGEQGLVNFGSQQHGDLLNLVGRPASAKRYYIGNPLVALSMTSKDLRAGLYAPLSVFVYEMEAHVTRIEYDRPSSLFGQFGNSEVEAVSKELDEKLARLIEIAAQQADAKR